MKLHEGLAVTSIVNSTCREISEEDCDYGGRIYPFELLVCYANFIANKKGLTKLLTVSP